MSDVPATPAAPETVAAPVTATNPAPEKYADKYDTPEALLQATHEAHKLLGLPALTADNPVVKDVKANEAYYKTLNTMISKGLHKTPPSVPIQAVPGPPPTNKAPEGDAPAPPAAPAPAKPKERSEVLKAIGVTEADLQAQIESSGDLSADIYAKLTAAGVSEADARAEVAKAKQNLSAWREGDAIAGSREQHQALRSWVTQNIKGADLAAIEKLAADPATYAHAVRLMQAKYAESIGAERSGSPLIGGLPATTQSEVTSFDDVSALLRAARSGDVAAIQEFDRRVSPKTLHRLTNPY